MEKLTPEEAGKYLGTPENPTPKNTLAFWRCRGKGPRYIKIGAKVFYLKTDLDAFMRQGLREPQFRS